MIYHSIFFIVASVAIGFLLYELFYWRQMHALVWLEDGVLDAPHILLICAIIGLFLSFF